MAPIKDINVLNYDATACHQGLEDLIFRCPSVFGRLWAVSEFRDANRDLYTHPLGKTYGPVGVDRELREIHVELFRTWLTFSLERQERELWVWFTWLAWNDEETKNLTRRIERQHRRLIPHKHLKAEADLFLADLELVFLVIKIAEQEQSSSARAHSTVPKLLRSLVRPLLQRSSY